MGKTYSGLERAALLASQNASYAAEVLPSEVYADLHADNDYHLDTPTTARHATGGTAHAEHRADVEHVDRRTNERLSSNAACVAERLDDDIVSPRLWKRLRVGA